MSPRDSISAALRAPKHKNAPALVAYLTGGYPDGARFLAHLDDAADVADVIEVGVPFSDPMADGIMIQRTSQVALEQGATLAWIFEALAKRPRGGAPILLMSYVNPLLAFGYDKLASAAIEANVAGFIIPDMPFEESGDVSSIFEEKELGLVQFTSPPTTQDRLEKICARATGFTYAIASTGITGQDLDISQETLDYLARVRGLSKAPVCAGFGIRNAAHVAKLAPHVDGVIVGSALMSAVEKGESPGAFLRSLLP